MNQKEYAHQDWNTVTLHRTYTPQEKLKRSQRTGETVTVEKRQQQAINKISLDNETEVFNHKKTGLKLGQQIQQARVNKKLSQKDLAHMLNEKPQIIQQYENGQAIPNPQLLNKMQTKLGVKFDRTTVK